MSAAIRVLALSALVVGLCPALAFACDDEPATKAHAKAHAKACKVEAKACAVKTKTHSTATATADDTKCSASTSKVTNTSGPRRAWEPGHLIEPDSMKLGPDLDGPGGEQWVILSSRGGVVLNHKLPWTKKEGRGSYPYGPYRVVLFPQLP